MSLRGQVAKYRVLFVHIDILSDILHVQVITHV